MTIITTMTSHPARPGSLVMFGTYRIGEAKNPGPTPASHHSLTHLGCLNPTGIMGKGAIISQLPGEGCQQVWGVSETHLTAPGITKFRQELRFHAPHLQFRASHPAPPKSAGIKAIGGQAKGVGFLSSAPCRPNAHNGQLEQWDTARLMGCSFLLGHRWVHGGVAYGYAYKAVTKQVQQDTEALLTSLTRQVVEGTAGPRFLMGDWNQLKHDLDTPRQWEKQGWVEVQAYAQQAWRQPVQPTCKRTTTKDFIYISPELVPHLRSVHVDDTFFADHALLWITLGDLGRPPIIPLWRMPKPLPSPLTVPSHDRPIRHPDTTECYRQVWQEYEHRASTRHGASASNPVQLGRAQTTDVTWGTQERAPPTKGSTNTTAPLYGGGHLGHARWLRQVRRLESLLHLLASPKPWEERVEAATGVWHAIVRAPGFAPSFTSWCNRLCLTNQSLPGAVPTTPLLGHTLPSRDHAQLARDLLLAELRCLEKALMAQRIAQGRQARIDCPSKIFQDLQKERQEAVSTIVAAKRATVTAVDEESRTVQVHPPGDLDASAPIFGPQGLLEVVELQPGSLRLAGQLPMEGDTLKQEQFQADPTQVFNAFEKEWEVRWDKHRATPDQHWQPFIDWFRQAIPPATQSMPLPPITLAEWRKAVKGKKSKSATGSDGVSRQDLINLPDDLTQSLLAIIRQVEEGQFWPEAMMEAMVTALAKTADSAYTSQFRPITVIPLAYRVWSTIRSRQLIRWLLQFAPPTLIGNLPGRTTAEVWYSLQEEIETSLADGRELAGMATDVVKCYNTLPRWPILCLAQHLGVGPQLAPGTRA